MSLLSVTVKKARYVGIQATQFNTYVTLKLQNVKSTTVTVKGPTPSWEQDFLFEINDINLGLLVEVWNKGVIWDRALGYHYLPLASVAYNEECGGRWIELEAQLMMRGGAVVGTTGPTGHALMLDCRFEQPFDAEGTGGADLQRKLDLLNGALDAERAEQARRQMQYIAHSGYSEDSDYTSDLNYPVGQHANCSASQFRSAAHQMHTPQRSLEVSRENSYERDEYHLHGDADPLYYNSQPRTRIESWSQYQPELIAQASVESAISWRTAADWQSGEDQRRPSLERQNTLYDDISYGYDAYSITHIREHAHLSHQPSYEEYYDSTSYPPQWEGAQFFFDDGQGLTPLEYENIVNKRRTSIVNLPQLPASSRYSDFNGMAPYRPRQRRTAASLPATPSSTPKRGRALPVPPGSESGSIRSGRGRRLPQPPSNAAPIVPYIPEPEKVVPDVSYGYDSYEYQPAYHDATVDQYQDPNYNATYDEDGMQPFFDETPHATPPAAVAKTTWGEVDTTVSQFTYPTKEDDNLYKSQPSAFLPEPPVTRYQETFNEYDQEYEMQQDDEYNQYGQEEPYQDTQKYEQKDYSYQQQYEQTQFDLDQKKLQDQQLQQFQQQQQQLQFQKQQQYQQQQQQNTAPQQPQPTQQLQATVMTGAATLGSFMAGGAKKLGSLFGAAAAAVAPPLPVQPQTQATAASATPFNSILSTPVTIYTSSVTVPVASVPEVTSVPVPTVTTSAPVTLPRTPSLRRQESIQRPSVRRTRTLPDAPEDFQSTYDESAYEDEFNKTDYEQSVDRVDRVSLDRYRDDDFIETIQEESEESRSYKEERSPSLQKTASPTRNGTHIRKPSVDSFHSNAPSVIDRRTSQSSFHHEDKLTVPVSVPTTSTHEVILADKSKISFKDKEKPTFHEVPEPSSTYQDGTEDEMPYEDQETDDYRPDQEYQDDEQEYRDGEKYEDQEQFNEADEQYPEEESVFQEEAIERQERKIQEDQPKLTPKQRWHRAYNKIVMQLNDWNSQTQIYIFYRRRSCNFNGVK